MSRYTPEEIDALNALNAQMEADEAERWRACCAKYGHQWREGATIPTPASPIAYFYCPRCREEYHRPADEVWVPTHDKVQRRVALRQGWLYTGNKRDGHLGMARG